MVRGTVEETLNGLLDAEAGEMCRAQRYERSPERIDTRAGHYTRKLQTEAGEVELKMPKLRRQTFETAIIERYRRREISVEEAIVQMLKLPRQALRGSKCRSRYPAPPGHPRRGRSASGSGGHDRACRS